MSAEQDHVILPTTLEVPPRGGPVLENAQDVNLKFAFARVTPEKVIGTHFFVKCRDFLHDMVALRGTGKECIVYGMRITHEQCPEHFALLIQLPGGKVSGREVDWELWPTTFMEALKRILPEGKQPFVLKDMGKHKYLLTGDDWWLTHIEQIDVITMLARYSFEPLSPDMSWNAWAERIESKTSVLIPPMVMDRFMEGVMFAFTKAIPLTLDELLREATPRWGSPKDWLECGFHGSRGIVALERHLFTPACQSNFSDHKRMYEVLHERNAAL